MVYKSRSRGFSDNLLTHSSSLFSALSGSGVVRDSEEKAIEEEYKSEDEMRRVISDDSSEESCHRGNDERRPCSREGEDKNASEISDEGFERGGVPFLEPDALCKEHKLKVHSWHKRSRKYLCTQCIQSTNLPNEEIQIFAQAVREIKTRMLEAKELNKMRKMQLTSVMSHVTDAQRRNRVAAENKLSQHLQQVKKLMDDYEMSCKL